MRNRVAARGNDPARPEKGTRARSRLTRAIGLCLLPTALACGGATGFQAGFEPDWSWDEGAEARSIVRRLSSARPPPTVPVAVGVTAGGLVGRVLPEGKRWEYRGKVDTLPAVSAGAVAFSGDGFVHLLDAKTGEPVWKTPLETQGRQLESMAHDGKRTLLVLADPNDSRRDRLIAVDPDGSILAQATPEPALGRPALVGGVGLVPFSAQYVTALDLAEGTSLGRILVRNATTIVTADAGGIYLEGHGVLPLDQKLARDPDQKPLELPPVQLPGSPPWPGDGTQTRKSKALPIAIYAHPTTRGNRLAFAHDRYAATYFRVVLGLDAKSGELRWATHFLRNVVGGAASNENITLCFEDGSLWRLSYEDGQRESSGTLDAKLRACVVEAEPRSVRKKRDETLEEQVVQTLIRTGPDMAAVHSLLLEQLSSSDSPEVTARLLEIAQSPQASADLADRAAGLIAQRRSGAEHMIQALEEEPDLSTARRPAPLAEISTALAAMNVEEAAAPLAKHLIDPSASLRDQVAMARALSKLATAKESAPLSEYFLLYRSAAAEPELAQAVLLVAETLLRVGDEETRASVYEAARDPLTHPNVREELRKRLPKGGERARPQHRGSPGSGPPTSPPAPVAPPSPPRREPARD